jgi:hypothetical protein
MQISRSKENEKENGRRKNIISKLLQHMKRAKLCH